MLDVNLIIKNCEIANKRNIHAPKRLFVVKNNAISLAQLEGCSPYIHEEMTDNSKTVILYATNGGFHVLADIDENNKINLVNGVFISFWDSVKFLIESWATRILFRHFFIS